MDIGTTIKKARLQKGLTQEELAEKVGVKKSAVAKWENGRVSEIKRTNLKMLVEVLGLRPTELLGDVQSDPVGTANELADIYHDIDLWNMIKQYNSLDAQKKAQVREYVHLLSAKA